MLSSSGRKSGREVALGHHRKSTKNENVSLSMLNIRLTRHRERREAIQLAVELENGFNGVGSGL